MERTRLQSYSPLQLRARAELERRRRQATQIAAPTYAPEFRGGALALQSHRGPEVMLSGPSETGKTWSTLWYLDTFLRTYAGAQGALIRKKRVTIAPTVLRTYLRIQALRREPAVPHGGNNPLWYDYANGSRLWIGGIDDPGKILSGERDIIYVNQAEELEIQDWETITTRTTGRGAVAPFTVALGDCNPGPADHWIIKRRDSGALTFLESRHEDNPSLHDGQGWTEQGQRTLTSLNKLTGVRKQRLRYGLWVGAEGAYFTQLDEDLHMVTYRRVPDGWHVWGALDYGWAHPLSFGVLAIDPEDRVYLLGRHAADHWYIPQHDTAIRGLCAALGVVLEHITIYAGGDCWSKGKDQNETVADKLTARGYRLERANDARVPGARAVGERLGNQECDPPVPASLFFNTLHGGRAVFDALARMVVDPHDAEDVLKVNADTDGQGGDDDYDMARYGVMAVAPKSEDAVVGGQPRGGQLLQQPQRTGLPGGQRGRFQPR